MRTYYVCTTCVLTRPDVEMFLLVKLLRVFIIYGMLEEENTMSVLFMYNRPSDDG